MNLGRSLVLSCGLFALLGCGSDKAKDGGAPLGAGGEAGQTADGGTAGSGVNSSGSGGGKSGGSGGSGGGLLGVAGSDSGEAGATNDSDPTYDGIDLTTIGSVAPASCTGGLVGGVLTIALDASVPAVLLSVVGGEIQANGVTCTTSSGEHATPSNVTSIGVTGSAADEKLYFDLSNGSFAGVLAGGVNVDLADGNDQLIVIGTTGNDQFSAGSNGDETAIDVTADGTADLHAKHIESLLITSGAGNDSLSADGSGVSLSSVAIPVSLYGGSGDDTLTGGAAADALSGGSGQDVFDAGSAPSGSDTFDGGAGIDTADFSARSNALNVTLVGGADDGEVGENIDVQASVEIVLGGAGDDVLTGNELANQLSGGPGNDTLSGGAGDDFLYGGDGNDTINGDDGDDMIYGEAGDDILHGGDGDDIVDGFTGKNVIDGGPGDGDICVSTATDMVTACEL
ncbi:MAG TPA: calcium-binding protein [Polyangiaceae bacterium]|jgi:Ca2+-binding RTX toxin-like protein